ncbi:hypothetical protein ACWXWB_10120 [Pantoea dispersa]|uniref:hypothetical protein n=1 Tax=Pantoea dispersa TaxID=59814 RepID=UPI002DB666A1|nr:hypothetical protein [Pantoea dispersa]MEB5971027.1 hypothetical protein [Pantoea dispersa]
MQIPFRLALILFALDTHYRVSTSTLINNQQPAQNAPIATQVSARVFKLQISRCERLTGGIKNSWKHIAIMHGRSLP